LAGAIIILIFFGLRRDKKRAAAFQADLVQRRRARRERAQASEKS
jgi:Flp pilus assembly protein protease CpaA